MQLRLPWLQGAEGPLFRPFRRAAVSPWGQGVGDRIPWAGPAQAAKRQSYSTLCVSSSKLPCNFGQASLGRIRRPGPMY